MKNNQATFFSFFQNKKDSLAEIRDCCPEDACQFPRFAAKVAEETNFTLHWKGKKYPVEPIKETWKKAFVSPSEFYLGAFSPEKGVIGQLHFRIMKPTHPRVKHVGEFNIMLLKQYWGTGLANIMMKTMEKRAKQMGALRIEATVIVKNHRATAFYQKLGYKIEGTRKNSIDINGILLDEYYISKLI